MIQGGTEDHLKKTLTTNSFKSTYRHGKFLFIGWDRGGHLMLHFGLTGDLHHTKAGAEGISRYVIHFHFDDDSSLFFQRHP